MEFYFRNMNKKLRKTEFYERHCQRLVECLYINKLDYSETTSGDANRLQRSFEIRSNLFPKVFVIIHHNGTIQYQGKDSILKEFIKDVVSFGFRFEDLKNKFRLENVTAVLPNEGKNMTLWECYHFLKDKYASKIISIDEDSTSQIILNSSQNPSSTPTPTSSLVSIPATNSLINPISNSNSNPISNQNIISSQIQNQNTSDIKLYQINGSDSNTQYNNLSFLNEDSSSFKYDLFKNTNSSPEFNDKSNNLYNDSNFSTFDPYKSVFAKDDRYNTNQLDETTINFNKFNVNLDNPIDYNKSRIINQNTNENDNSDNFKKGPMISDLVLKILQRFVNEADLFKIETRVLINEAFNSYKYNLRNGCLLLLTTIAEIFFWELYRKHEGENNDINNSAVESLNELKIKDGFKKIKLLIKKSHRNEFPKVKNLISSITSVRDMIREGVYIFDDDYCDSQIVTIVTGITSTSKLLNS